MFCQEVQLSQKANTGPIGLILKCNGEKLPDVHALEFATKYENKLF